MSFEATGLWKRTLGRTEQDDGRQCERLRQAYSRLRDGVSVLAAEIHRDLPDFTVHDITHIDALWTVADTIAGPDYPLTPLEGFVLGGAFLLHDLGMGLASWPERRAALRAHKRWRDTIASLLRHEHRRVATSAEIDNAPEHIQAQASRELLRLLHAEQAERLLEVSWRDDEGGPSHLLLEDEPLRFHLGPLIGKIAHSHWWDIDRVQREFRAKKGPPPGLPGDWIIDALKLAALLRAADAAHLDDRRAPRFLRAARALTGIARSHWVFQGHMLQLREEGGRLVFTATRPFAPSEAAAWWLARETLQMVDRELHSVDALLADEHRPCFVARGVAGVESPMRLKELIPTQGWEPVEARIRVDDIAGLVERLGGRELYGNAPTVPLRELIQNASDAIQARRVLEDREPGWGRIIARIGYDKTGHWIEVEDNGVGMSRAVLTGALLDFGESYWGSTICREEHIGLLAKGFEPIGRYGIGFFSVFMWGERVRVTSQRYDQGKADTRVLEFGTSLRASPVLREAMSEEYLREGGTRVRVWLKDAPNATGGLLHRANGKNPRALARVCVEIAPALETDLWTEEGGKSECVLRAGDWRTIDGGELLRRLPPLDEELQRPDVRQWFDEMGQRVRPIIVPGTNKIIGRACVDREPSWHRTTGLSFSHYWTPSAITVGGLRAGYLSGIHGILTGRPLRADRMTSVPLADGLTLSSWATEQGQLLTRVAKPSDELADMAETICFLGGQASQLPIAFSNAGWLSLKDLAVKFAKADQVLLVQDAALSNNERVAPVALDDGVIAISMASGINFLRSVSSWDRAFDLEWPSTSCESSENDVSNIKLDTKIRLGSRSVLNAVVAALSKAWDVPERLVWEKSELYSDDNENSRRIGLQNGAPLFSNVHIICRPRC